MRTPDKGIPQDLLETAKCVAIIPGEEKLAFIFGGKYGKGRGDVPHCSWLERSDVYCRRWRERRLPDWRLYSPT